MSILAATLKKWISIKWKWRFCCKKKENNLYKAELYFVYVYFYLFHFIFYPSTKRYFGDLVGLKVALSPLLLSGNQERHKQGCHSAGECQMCPVRAWANDSTASCWPSDTIGLVDHLIAICQHRVYFSSAASSACWKEWCSVLCLGSCLAVA